MVSNPGVTIADVKVQEAAYEELRKRFSEKYLRLANLGTAMYYDLGIDTKLWQTLADHALGKTIIQTPQLEKIVSQAMDIAKKKGFFHWDLEFPGIFFDSQGHPLGNRAGFDVVIGNPPYVRQEQLGPDKSYFREHYEVHHGKADLFVYFFAQGLRLLRNDGRLTYISSNMWLRTNYATSLRQYLRTQTTVETIIDLGNTRVFADAPDLSPSIQIVRKALPIKDYKAKVAIFGRSEHVTDFRKQLADKIFPLSIHDQLDAGWQMTVDAPRLLFAKIMAMSKPLGEVVDGHMYYGIKTGLNEAFIIDQSIRDRLVKDDPSCAAIIKPMLRGEDLRPWYQENEGRWLIFTRHGIDINAYPSVLSHLQQFREQLEPRPSNWNDEHTWPGRKPGPYQWYEIQDSIDYYNAFEQTKIFWPDIAKFSRFSWDEQGLFINNKGYILPSTDIALLGILQSRLTWFCITKLCAPLGERLGLLIYQHFTQFIKNLPIPLLTDTQRETIGTLARHLTEVARQRYEVRRKTTCRIQSDLGTAEGKLNQRLTTWWVLSFKEFREEIVKVFKHDIPLKEREDWEIWLGERRTEIEHFTNEIITLETQLNGAVYEAFGLDNDEIALIEQETKYQYGEW
jgi:Eco57I restriction-modification methylase/TaqI-like C-terminal specificity domain